MRRGRLKEDPVEGACAYHCMSRTVNSEWLFEEADRERLRQLIWSVADFCGVEVITYAIMSNHFHVLVIVPKHVPVPAEEVIRRYAVLYPAPAKYRPEHLDIIRMEVARGSQAGLDWLDKQRRQMGDVSHYMKLLKQRFTVLFNILHKRHGTLWSERFKSTLVEEGVALATVANYIDLNPVRAGLVIDPKDYRYCGYAEAVAGNVAARRGITLVTETASWADASSEYRVGMFGAACKPRPKGQVLSLEILEKVVREKGMIPKADLLHCRMRYFTDGAVFGSRGFVQAQLDRERRKYGRSIGLEPKSLPSLTDWGTLSVMRRPRARAVAIETLSVTERDVAIRCVVRVPC